MGAPIDRETFDDVDRRRFGQRLRECLEALDGLLARPGFGEGPPSLGAELELHLVDETMRPRLRAQQLLERLNDRRFSLEIGAFNVELNADPLPLAGRPFEALATQLDAALGEANAQARRLGAVVLPIGILPTLERADLGPHALTQVPRFRALSKALLAMQGGPFPVRIDGDELLELHAPDVTFEAANTSFQVHLRVAPQAFAAAYNAAELATGPTLAVACNSPFFLGKALWRETRIMLFRQAIDDRPDPRPDDWRPARVSFGHGWVRESARELFAESVALHEPVLPVVADEDPVQSVRRGEVPELSELRLHQGTVWHWNRAVYDQAGGGHLRIEMRALPAGPTVVDMVANSAFQVGLVLGLAPQIEELTTGLLFHQARRNFYEAARHGLDAQLLWPTRPGERAEPMPVTTLVQQLLEVAQRGLVSGGVDANEATRWLSIIDARVRAGRSGATWQLETMRRLDGPRREAFRRMTGRYTVLSREGRPVHEWEPGA